MPSSPVEKQPWVDTPARQVARQRAHAARSLRAVERAEQSFAAVDDCRTLLSGIDTLNLSTRAPLRSGLVDELKGLRELAVAAKKSRKGGTQKAELPRWRANALNIDFEVQPYGTRKGLCLLSSEQLVLVLNPDGPRNFPRAYVELKAPFLWSGWQNAAAAAEELLRETVTDDADLDTQVSRLDLCCDFDGWCPKPELLDQMVGRVVRRDLNFEWGEHEKKEQRLAPFARAHGQGRRFTGFTFGGGDLLARLYDKTVEIQRSGKKWFEPKWQAAGWKSVEESGHVWRLEFQVRREPLRQSEVSSADAASQMKSWADVKRGLDPLWAYLTTHWLSYRLPRTATERVRIHPRWQRLASVRFAPHQDATLHRHHEQIALERCTGALAGYLKRELALMWKAKGVAPSPHRFESDAAELLTFSVQHYNQRHETELYEAARAQWKQNRSWEKLFGRFAQA